MMKPPPPVVTTPPRQKTLLTPDGRPGYPQEAGAFYKVAPVFMETIQVKRYFETPIPTEPYTTVLSFVRGFAGAAAVAPLVPPAIVFAQTAQPFVGMVKPGDAFFPP